MGLNPVSTSNFIYERFSDYAVTSLYINDEIITQQLRELLKDPRNFSKGPIIEATPPYATGSNILELVNEGILSRAFMDFNSSVLPLDRKLYKHQEVAIKKICQDSRNVVVATGTGSGKTESFMIPILNYLLELKSNDNLRPGVKALLLYPMNALANDQMKRLRKLLKNELEITFGIYTGETEEKYQDALDKFIRMHQEEPLNNELISREQMKKTPPHILLTNYAMLEYLMLRPEDNVFFEGKFSNDWKFVVIDEAHTYTGSNGIEMSMLLSRLKNTIGLQKGDLRCILTSASLGNGKEDFPKVADFAEKLFREEFTHKDIVEATKQDLEKGNIWGQPTSDFYGKLFEKIEKNNYHNLKELLVESDIPLFIIDQAYNLNEENPIRVLYNILLGDQRINNTISILSKRPIDFETLSKMIFPNNENSENYMASLIDVCNYIRISDNHSPLIPARYHYFIRALEGAFIVFADKPYIYLNRMNKTLINEEEYKAFEIGTCRRCNALYLVGEIIEDNVSGYSYLKEYDNKYLEEDKDIEYFAILEDNNYIHLDNEDEILEDIKLVNSPFSIFNLCTKCGGIKDDINKETCGCISPKHIKLLKVKSKGQQVKKCGICGGVNPNSSIVRRFFLAEDTVSSVLSTALYNKIPNKTKRNEIKEPIADIFGTIYMEENKVNKQLLIFSDNRQSAAYFATYLNTSYQDMLIKSILTKVILDNSQICIKNSWSLGDYHRRIEKFVIDNNILSNTIEFTKKEIWKWIIGEFITNSSNSLINMGYLLFTPNFDILENSQILFEVPFLKQDGFTKDELITLYGYLLEQFRTYRAIEYPEYVNPIDQYFSPINTQGAFCRTIVDASKKHKRGYSVKSWRPSEERYSNSRLDYISKIYKSKGIDVNKNTAIKVLDNLYDILINERSPFRPYIKIEHTKEYGQIIKLDPLVFKVTPGILDKSIKYYKCNRCHKINTININNVCPSYRCDGVLYEIDIEKEFKENHYRKLYTNFGFEKMQVSEHTAQLKTEYAAEVQNKFINGEINVLSCSTTFELGVDVGELETVFMKNMPPTPANYAQRAGRAGRRLDSTAYALTYSRLASHDFSNFADPYKMISGTVKPPYFDVTNEKIARRHMYACALSAFWKAHEDYFRTVEDFFLNEKGSGPDLLRNFLNKNPNTLHELIKRVIPSELHTSLKIDSWGWVDDLYNEEGVMTKITAELNDDLERLESAKKEAALRNNYGLASELHGTINTIRRRPLINYLSQKNLLPKYGFPVDVVNLEANFHTQEAKNVELSRDLQIAISEYAPGGQIIANGKLWTSRYVKKVRKKDLIRNKYFSCSCGYFETVLYISEKKIAICPICGNAKIKSGTYMMPDFGFITETTPKDPGNTRPERTYSSRKHFSGNGSIIKEEEIIIGGKTIKINAQKHGLLTVINNGKGSGFHICKICGYGVTGNRPSNHNNSDGKECKGIFERVSLGYDFETDIVEIDFQDAFRDMSIVDGFWESLMYSIIEGMSSALEIDRSDVDGTLYIKNQYTKSIVLFDTVPGGAGHVKRLLDEDQFMETLIHALDKVSKCSCGGESRDTSCYNCLRNYYNQYCHDKLNRGFSIDALEKILEKKLVEA